MGGRLRYLLGICASLVLAGCAMKNGDCRISESEVVNTYSVLGHWKKISGYKNGTQPQNLDLNYEYLIVEPGAVGGGIACSAEASMGGYAGTNFVGQYSVNLKQETITLPSAGVAKYKFSGSCSDTQMKLTYANNVEVYELLDKSSATGDCGAN
jgi:hypothetical protein